MPDIFDEISVQSSAGGDIFDQIAEPSIPPPPGLPGIPKPPIPPELQQDNRAWLNRPVSDSLVKSVANKTAPGVDMGPTISGVSSMIRGAGRAARNLPAVADPGVPNAPAPGGDFGEFAGGLSDIVRGGMEAAMPAMPAAIAAAPLRTAAALATGTAATEGVQAGAEKLGVPQGAAALLGDIAGVGLGGLVGHPALRKMKSAMEEAPRDASQIRTEPEPVAPEPVAPGPAPVARPPQARPIEATPAAAPVDIFDSVQPEGREGVIQQPAETVSPRASVPQAREIARKEIPLGEETSPEAQAAETQGLLTPVTDQARIGERGAVGAPSPLTPAQQIVRANVAAREKARVGPARKAQDAVGEMYRDIKATALDSLAPVEDLIAAAQKQHGYEIRPEHDFTNQADRVLRYRSLAGRFVDEHGLAKVIKEVPDLEEFGQYLIAKHARNVEADGFKTGRNPATDAVLIDELGPKYEPYAKQLQQFDQKLLDYTVDSGLISRELADQLRALYPDYVPLNRVFAEIEKPDNPFATGKGVANLSRQTVIQKLKGSEREIENPIGSLLNKTYAALQQGEKNKAARLLASYKDLPGFEDLINPQKKFRTGASSTFSYIDNGRKVTLDTTPEIAAAVKSLDVQNLGVLLKIIAGPARMFKLFTTAVNPAFFLANIARDQQTAFINSKNPFATSALNQKLFWKSMWDVITHDNSYKEMVDAAAGGSSWDVYRQEPMRTAGEIRSERNLGTRLAYRASHPAQLWPDFENALARSEEYTRLQQYQGTKAELLREGRTPQDAEILAAKAARENTANFSRRGNWGQVLNAFAPYFNASLQGSRAFVRSASRQPVRTFTKVGTNVLFPVAMLTLYNLADEKRAKAYRDIRAHEKENSLLFIPPNPTQDERGRWNVVKVPLDPGVGDMAIPFRRWIEQAHGMNPVKFSEVVSAFFNSISPVNADWRSVASNLTPQFAKPTLENITNQNFFTGAPHVPDNLKKAFPNDPSKWVRPWTSGTARLVSKPLGVSPIQTEEFIKGTIGGAAPNLINAVDAALAATGKIPWNQVGGQTVKESVESRFMKAAGGEDRSKQIEADVADKAAKSATKHTANQRLIGSMSLRDAIAQFSKMTPAEQAETRTTLQKRVSKGKGIPPYLFPQLRSLGFTVR